MKNTSLKEMRKKLEARFKHAEHLSNVEVRRMYNMFKITLNEDN